MGLGDGDTWDETSPTNATLASTIDDYHRHLLKAIRSRLAFEHEWPSSQGATSEAGKHRFITLQDQAAKPTIAGTQLAAVYTKTVGAGLQELFWENEAGVEVQVTSRDTTNAAAPQFRDGMKCTRTGTTTIQVDVGKIEINGGFISKTSITTLTLSTDADWAGGSSLRTTSDYGYVGIDASGNLKMHTTAPTHSNYDVSITAGIKRYATWSGTVYRIIGWFYMNATGSGELNAYEVGNLKDVSISNTTGLSSDVDVEGLAAYGDDTESHIHFYSSGGAIFLQVTAGVTQTNTSATLGKLNLDTVDLDVTISGVAYQTSSAAQGHVHSYYGTLSEGEHHVYYKCGSSGGGTTTVRSRTILVQEF